MGQNEYRIFIECENVKFNGEWATLEYFENKNKFIHLIMDVSARLGDALEKDIKITGLYDFDSQSIGASNIIKIYLISKWNT